MRAVWAGLTAVGAVALVATVSVDLARGDPSGAGWMLVGPGPFWAAGVIGAWRQPGRLARLWLLAAGAFFMAESAGDDILTPPVKSGLYAKNLMTSEAAMPLKTITFGRSEERGVGKECRSRWSTYH